MILHVTRILSVRGRELRLEFTDGAIKDVDLSQELFGEVFEPLREDSFFLQVQLDPDTRTVAWPNGADFAPELLYDIGRDVKQVA